MVGRTIPYILWECKNRVALPGLSWICSCCARDMTRFAAEENVAWCSAKKDPNSPIFQ